jgi:hypothetical protein
MCIACIYSTYDAKGLRKLGSGGEHNTISEMCFVDARRWREITLADLLPLSWGRMLAKVEID